MNSYTKESKGILESEKNFPQKTELPGRAFELVITGQHSIKWDTEFTQLVGLQTLHMHVFEAWQYSMMLHNNLCTDLLVELSVVVGGLNPRVDIELIRGWVLHTDGTRLRPLPLLTLQQPKVLPGNGVLCYVHTYVHFMHVYNYNKNILQGKQCAMDILVHATPKHSLIGPSNISV